MDIYLNDLLRFTPEELQNDRIKVKFNIWNGYENPIDVYKRDPDEINGRWLLWREKRRYFRVGDIAICLVRLDGDRWLLTGVKRITKDLDVAGGVNYEAEDVARCKAMAQGRIIVRYHKYHTGADRWYCDVCNDLIVSEVLPASYDGDEFPGYDRVRLSYSQLETVIRRHRSDWVNALESQKAVYLISDRATGKMYVGSATSDNGMLLARWSSYVTNGHGGNVELVELVKDKGFDYVKTNFIYSILENYNARIPDEQIRARESWWKEMLMTRQFGYNSN